MSKFRNAAFISLALLIAVLVCTTLLDHLTGVPGTSASVYTSWPVIALWGVISVLSATYILCAKMWKMPITFLLHLSFLVILTGALTTHVWGKQGSMTLEKDYSSNTFIREGGQTESLPFQVLLQDFHVTYYSGTKTPQDYVSKIMIVDKGKNVEGQVSMNHVFSYQGYRFYQAGYDPSLTISHLSLSYDPYGIGITYTGYALLFLSMLLFFIQPGSQFRKILRNKSMILTGILCMTNLSSHAENLPKIIPSDLAHELGEIYILHNGRVCPLQTYAKDFTTKLYGKDTYRGRSSEEVLAGWMFYPDSWKPEPMIKLKGGEVKYLLKTEQTYVSLLDFAEPNGDFKLQMALERIQQGEDVPGRSNILNANEKIAIINSLFTGASLKIFPIQSSKGEISWYSLTDKLPADLDVGQSTFIRKSLDFVAEKIRTHEYDEAKELIQKIKAYQIKECGHALPSETEFRAEITYNSIGSCKIWAMIAVTIGLLSFFYFVFCTARKKGVNTSIRIMLNVLLVVILFYLSYCMYLRTVISHHLPLSNGYETMQALAWCSFLLTLVLQRRFHFALPFGYIVGGMALLVAMMGQSNPAITNLIPVLQSPLLSMHVMVIMIAYALLAFTMLNGFTAIYFLRKREMEREAERLQRLSLLMLYPAVFLLTTGIFIGAIWANISWGRYWGWDPKEVWALITMLLYSIPLHGASLAFIREPKWFHTYMILAFLSVLFTYFGVNYLLGGMHSYAAM